MSVFLVSCVLAYLTKYIRIKKFQKIRKKLLSSTLRQCIILFSLAVIVGLAGFEGSFLYSELCNCVVILILLIPIKHFFKKVFSDDKDKEKIEVTDEDMVPKTVDGRVKIIEKFNEKYNLTLSKEQIDKIANSSFQDDGWLKEIVSMTKKYSTISEWYQGDTDWLRAYIKSFNVMNISTDFNYQKEICLNNFKEAFQSADTSNSGSIDECINKINNQYMSNFDELTFMIAHKFLDKNKCKFDLPKARLVNTKSEINDLINKYDNNDQLTNKKQASEG